MKLRLVETAKLGERGGLPRPLVVTHARDAGEAKREARRIRRALLDLVVFDLDDDLGSDLHRVAVVGHRERSQAFRHLHELSIGEALEGLTDLRELVPVDDRKVVVGQPANAAAGAAVGGDDHAVDRFRGLQLEPALAAAARRIG